MLSPVTVTTRTGAFAYLAAGPEDGPRLICLHGFPDTARGFEPLIPLLTAGGYRVIVPWLRGYAPSVLSGPYLVEQLADDLLGLADAIAPGAPVGVVGHDWGAAAAYAAMARAPERFFAGVALGVPHPLAVITNVRREWSQLKKSWYMLFFQLPLAAEWALPRRDFALIDRLWRDWSPGWEPPAEHMRDVKDCLAASMPAPIAYYRALPLQALTGRPATVKTPTLHLHGEHDGCVSSTMSAGEERWFEGPFDAQVLPEVGHFLHQERPALVAARILEWLERYRVGKAA